MTNKILKTIIKNMRHAETETGARAAQYTLNELPEEDKPEAIRIFKAIGIKTEDLNK